MMKLAMTWVFVLAGAALAPAAELGFRPAEKPGFFDFDTGAVRGQMQADNASQGLAAFVEAATGADLAHAPGLLSYYRLLSRDARWGEDFRSWPKSARVLDGGALEITWPPAADHPVELRATYRWKSPNTLDLETTLRPQQQMADVEVFLSSYFAGGFRSRVYVSAPRHTGGEPHFLPLDANPFTVGTYLAFPRDLRAAQLIYDGRWERGRNPVQFSVNRFLAAPLALKVHPDNGLTCVFMSRPDDCFAIEAPYDQTPPDGVAAHYSLYLSFFGRDLEAGQTARALMRLVVGRDVTEDHAIMLYRAFLGETH